jgi:hypothetical protein
MAEAAAKEAVVKEELASRKMNTSATTCLTIVEYMNDIDAHT